MAGYRFVSTWIIEAPATAVFDTLRNLTEGETLYGAVLAVGAAISWFGDIV